MVHRNCKQPPLEKQKSSRQVSNVVMLIRDVEYDILVDLNDTFIAYVKA